MTLEGPRVIDKPIPYIDITLGDPGATPPEPLFPATVTGDGWEILDNGPTPTFVYRTYYDLSGYAIKDLTSFVQGAEIQEAYPPFGAAACTIVDLITTEYIDDATLLAAYKYTTGDGDLPGFPQSTYDMNQVVYGRTRTFTTSTTWGDIAIQGTSSFGTGAATNAEKLYITRIVYSLTTGPSTGSSHIPPCDYVTAIIVGKEDMIPYLMRQKRSYEHTSGL